MDVKSISDASHNFKKRVFKVFEEKWPYKKKKKEDLLSDRLSKKKCWKKQINLNKLEKKNFLNEIKTHKK